MQQISKTALVHYSSPPIVGGVEAVISAHAQVLLGAGYPVDVISGRGDAGALPEGTGYVCIPEMDSQNPKVLEMNASLIEGTVPPGFDPAVRGLASRLGETLSGYSTVMIHNVLTKHFNMALTAALWSLIERGSPWKPVAWVHDISWTSEHSLPALHPGYPWDLLRRFDPRVQYVAVSQERRAALAGLLGCPESAIRVIYNGVSPEAFYSLSAVSTRIARELDLWRCDLIVLLPVRVTQAKNLELACRVAGSLKSSGLRCRFIVTGPPDPHDEQSMLYYSSLLDLRENLGVQEEVRFIFELGSAGGEGLTIGPQAVAELYRIADAVLMPSRREGFGMPVLEAGLLGLPVFSTPVPASVEIGGATVHLITDGMPAETISRQILEWARSSRSLAMKAKVRQGFTWQAIFDRDILPLLRDAQAG